MHLLVWPCWCSRIVYLLDSLAEQMLLCEFEEVLHDNKEE
jgi:hypothetical protein